MTGKPVQSEADFMAMVVQFARMHGWMVYHARPAMMRSGRWATAMIGDKGWPDMFLVRRSDTRATTSKIPGKPLVARALAVELKSEKGKPTDAQWAWLEALNAAGIEVRVWRPSQWTAIAEELT